MKKIALFISLIFSAPSFSNWDGVTKGLIQSIDVTHGENYGFRIILMNKPTLCGNEHRWAYINQSDSNYQTFMSVLLAAHLAKRPITIWTRKQNNAQNGYCHIGYISISE